MLEDRKKKKWKPIALLIGLFAVAAAAGLFGYTYYFNMAEEQVVAAEKAVRVDNLMSNLHNGGMIKLSVTVVVDQETDVTLAEDSLRNVLISSLRMIGKDELNGVAGLDFLKTHALSASRNALGADKVKEIYIREFIVQ